MGKFSKKVGKTHIKNKLKDLSKIALSEESDETPMMRCQNDYLKIFLQHNLDKSTLKLGLCLGNFLDNNNILDIQTSGILDMFTFSEVNNSLKDLEYCGIIYCTIPNQQYLANPLLVWNGISDVLSEEHTKCCDKWERLTEEQ